MMSMDKAYQESTVNLQGHRARLIGVRCSPVKATLRNDLCVVIVAGQPQTRVGAHRMFVQLARRLAQRGIASLRFDCAGWGDSLGDPEVFESSRFDVLSVVQALQSEAPARRIVVLGLCDGASAACLSLPLLKADQRRIEALVMINPWIDSQQMEARAWVSHYYLQRLLSRAFWTKLLRGQVQIGDAVGGAVKAVKQSAQSDTDSPDVSAQMAIALSASGVPVLLVLSGDDLTAQTFKRWMRSQSRIGNRIPATQQLQVPGADHTFSKPQDWLAACDWIAEQLGQLKPAD